MNARAHVRLLLALASTLLPAPLVFAQRQPLPDMQAIARSLGVTCEYCHMSAPGSRAPEPRKDIARAMLAMTRELNEKVQAATGKAPNEATAVTCVTCHRGVAIPGQLQDIMFKTWRKNGVEAAIAQFRDLRKQYYGRGSYDFGEETLLNLSQQMVHVKPDDALAVLRLNLEFNPNSAPTYAQIGFAYTRKFDDAAAIANYEKSIELDPQNGIVQGQLAQLKSYRRRPAQN